MKKQILIIMLSLVLIQSLGLSQTAAVIQKETPYRHAIETSPVSPLLQMIDKGIWGIKYEYALSEKSELKLGLAYMNIYFEEGHTNAPALIIGYRRFLRKNIYLEYELWPGYDQFYEKNEDKYYDGIDLWNEFRIGYQFDYPIQDIPTFVNVAWPFGFGLYSSNKPDSFYDRMNQRFGSKYFFHFPLIFVGVRF